MTARGLSVAVFLVVFLAGGVWWPRRLRAGYPRRPVRAGWMAQRPRLPAPARDPGQAW